MAQNPPLTTYQKARLQVVGYRAVQARVNELLSEHGINTSQWIILGWLHDNPQGLRVTALAEVLEVETPLITALLQPMTSSDLVMLRPDPLDGRAKLVTLATRGVTLVPLLEKQLTNHLIGYDNSLGDDEMAHYFNALQQFIYVSKQLDDA